MTQTFDRPAARGSDSVGALVKDASEDLSQLVRQELRLAQAEMRVKGKRYGRGGGLFGSAAVVGFLALAALVAAAVAGLALALPLWGSALIVGGVLLALAAVLAMLGRKEFGKAAPPAPEQAIDGVRSDVAEIKERAHR
ncbi:phage holin family protein [Streptomyces sp. NBC_01497]|uniref:phage holin family protein n=1 Tax=Streptomyces sp. NBC_01497 TaxID=2903885 RepID=UPI002E3455FB|nr:phage holin family protein [Streptomyces sp. NBC_01497]